MRRVRIQDAAGYCPHVVDITMRSCACYRRCTSIIEYNLVVTSRCVKADVRMGGRRRCAPSVACAASLHAMSASSRAPCLLLLCLVAGTSQLSIKEFVVPKIVEVGSDAELRCQYELGAEESEVALYVKWWWTPSSSSSDDRNLIYQRIAGHPPDVIQHVNASKIDVKDNDTIILTEVKPADSGTYECEVSNIDEIRKHDSLLIFSKGSGPEINYTLIKSEAEDGVDKLQIECEAVDIAPLPDITLTFEGEKVNISKTVEDADQDGLYKIFANATIDASDIGQGEIRCEVFYKNLEHPPYVDVEAYKAPGAAPSTTEVPDDATEPQAATDSLQNSRDNGVRLHHSWLMLTGAAVLICLQSLL